MSVDGCGMTEAGSRIGLQFKARVTLEAMKEQQTLVEFGQRFKVHPNQMAQWKKQLLEL